MLINKSLNKKERKKKIVKKMLIVIVTPKKIYSFAKLYNSVILSVYNRIKLIK